MGPVLSCARTTEEGNSDRCALFKAVCGCCRWCYLTTGQEAETEERLSEAKLNVVSSVGLRRASSGDVFAGEAKVGREGTGLIMTYLFPYGLKAM